MLEFLIDLQRMWRLWHLCSLCIQQSGFLLKLDLIALKSRWDFGILHNWENSFLCESSKVR